MKALLALDLTEECGPLVARATAWATRLGATLDLVHVATRPTLARSAAKPFRDRFYEQWQSAEEHLDAELAGLLDTLPDAIRGGHHRLVGPAAPRITELAEAFDVLLVGTQGRMGTPRGWLGSVAEKVVRTSPIPVLVLTPPREV